MQAHTVRWSLIPKALSNMAAMSTVQVHVSHPTLIGIGWIPTTIPSAEKLKLGYCISFSQTSVFQN